MNLKYCFVQAVNHLSIINFNTMFKVPSHNFFHHSLNQTLCSTTLSQTIKRSHPNSALHWFTTVVVPHIRRGRLFLRANLKPRVIIPIRHTRENFPSWTRKCTFSGVWKAIRAVQRAKTQPQRRNIILFLKSSQNTSPRLAAFPCCLSFPQVPLLDFHFLMHQTGKKLIFQPHTTQSFRGHSLPKTENTPLQKKCEFNSLCTSAFSPSFASLHRCRFFLVFITIFHSFFFRYFSRFSFPQQTLAVRSRANSFSFSFSLSLLAS